MKVGNKQKIIVVVHPLPTIFFILKTVLYKIYKEMPMNITVTMVFGVLDLLVTCTCTYTQQFVYDDDAIIAIQNNLDLVIFNKI